MYRTDTHQNIRLHTGPSTCSVTGATRGADHAYPSGVPDDIPVFGEGSRCYCFIFCGVRVQFCLFVFSLLLLFSLFV